MSQIYCWKLTTLSPYEEGLKEVFRDVAAITDYNGNLVLNFVDYHLDETPKYSVAECKERDVTYAAPLRVKATLWNKETGDVKENEVFMGDFPLMTESGTFVINPAYHIHTDFDRFEGNCRQLERTSDPDMRCALYHKAVELYKGHLLPRIEHEIWHMQLDMYYQTLYLTITKGYARYKLERKNYTDALREIKNAMQLAPGDSELSMLAVLAAWYQGGRVLARRYYEAVKKYLDGDQIIQIRTQLGF